MQRIERDRTICSNLLLKINAKLNGASHKLTENVPKLKDLLKGLDNVMFIGADVTHPSPDQKRIPSIVGVAASHDEFGACYNTQYRCQNGAEEIIKDMDDIIAQHLNFYKKQRKCFPSRIIYYRDGVSDGQMMLIQQKEIRAIKNVCARMVITKYFHILFHIYIYISNIFHQLLFLLFYLEM